MGHSQSTRRPKGRTSSPADSPKLETNQIDETVQVLSNMDHIATPTQCTEDTVPTFPPDDLPNPSPQEDDQPNTSSDSLAQDPDYELLSRFVKEGLVQEASPPITKILASSARVLSKFPTNENAVIMVTCTVLPLCLPSLPNEPPAQLMEVQMNALEAFSQLNISSNPPLVDIAMNFLSLLWPMYSSTLPAACNIKQLGLILNAALQLESKEDAIQFSQMFVLNLMASLSDSQLEALEKEGVFKNLRAVLHHYQYMDADTLRHLIAGIGLFAEVKPAAQAFLEENLYSDLVLAAQKYPSHPILQQVIWRLLTLFSVRDKSFTVAIADMEVIPSAVAVLKQEGSHLTPVLRFLTACCQSAENVYFAACLNDDGLMRHLLGIVKSDSAALEDKNNTTDFVALICTKAPKECLARLMELKIVGVLEEAALTRVDYIIPTYLAIEGMIKLLSEEQTSKSANIQDSIDQFYALDHHLFLQHALASPVVYSNQVVLEVVYLTLQKLLKLITPKAIKRMCNKEFLELYCVSFVRDTISFPSLANRVVFASHYLVFQIRDKESIQCLCDVNFHTPVVELVNSGSYEVMCTCLGLLSSLVSKYFEYLKDVKPFLETNVPTILLEKAKKYGHNHRSQFGDELSRILLNLTAEKELSVKLYKDGFLDQLLSNLDDSYTPVVKRCIIHAVGNIALGGQNVKEVLYQRNFHMELLSMLNREAEKGDASQLSACCRVLHILASGDAAKRQFVENNCVKVLLRIMHTRKDNPEICWRPLGLLSTLGFMALLNRPCILTQDVMTAIVKILKEDTHGKVLGYTMLVFLAYLQVDSGAVRMRQMAIDDRIREVSQNKENQKQSTDIERWGNHVLEKQDLYTIATPSIVTPPPCSPEDCRVSDWPFLFDSAGLRLLPLEDRFFEPQYPKAIDLTPAAKNQLQQLGIDLDIPLFRVGRVYGSTYGWCSNCEQEGTSYEMVIRVQSMTPTQYQHLIDNGWYRRGGVKMFRMMHNHSAVCCDWETRVSVKQFDVRSHKSYRKVLRRMPTDRLTVETLPRHFSREAFDLYNHYHITRHEKPQKSEFSYCEHVVDSPIVNQTIDGVEYGTFHQMYRLDGKLVAIGIVDIVPKGMVSIYMWYDVSKEVSKLSFGVYSALKEIEMVRERNAADSTVQYYYLQGWNPNNNKLSYKANYEPEEFYCPAVATGWVGSKGEVKEAIEQLEREKAAAKPEDMETNGETKETANTDQTDSAPLSKSGDPPKEADKDKKKKTSVPCETVEKDRQKHQQTTGSTTVDISKIIVCLNYSQYMYLGDLFEKFQVVSHQQELMKKRYEELYLSLCPELTGQLVIDLKACHRDGAVQVTEEVGVSVDTPTPVGQSNTGLS